MAKGITLFPALTENLLNDLKFQKRPYKFYYLDNDHEERSLITEQVEPGVELYLIKDENGLWSQDDYNIGFERKISIQSFNHLFGENGIACHDAKLGVAVQWKSADSKQRGTVQSGSFSSSDVVKDFVFEHLFQRAQLRGQVDFTTILYLAEAGHPYETEQHLINEEGYVLGELETWSVQLDGSGSIFPVFEVVAKGQPLWFVKCDWADPTVDKLTDCVSINLNRIHKNYKYIDRNQKTFNKQLLVEVMASAIFVVVENARQSGYWDDIVNDQNLDSGSVGEAIHYFQEALEWNLASPEEVSISARQFFEQRIS